MNIFKVIYSYFYYVYVKLFYPKLYKNDEKEAIYHKPKKSRYVIFVKDAEVGKRLYDVLKSLDLTVSYVPYAEFRFSKYGITLKKSIKWFSVEGLISDNWKHFSNLKQLTYIQYFVEAMQVNGFVLDDTKFDNFSCSSVCEFLSFFIQINEEEQIKRSKACMIQYIHYVYSNGGNLKEFFDELLNKGISEGYNIPYNSPIAQMCYEYYKTGTVPNSIYDVLLKGRGGRFESYTLVAIAEKLESNFKVTEETDEYTVYEGCMKIYKNMSPEFQQFLWNENIIDRSGKLTFEHVQAIIVDLNDNAIGYKFSKQDKPDEVIMPNSQAQIFRYVANIYHYLEKHHTRGHEKEYNTFDVEKSLVCTCMIGDDYLFRCITVKDWFNHYVTYGSILKEQITVLFFKLLANHIAQKYGELTSKKEFLEKNEVRFLSPIVAREFINFALRKTVNYQVATKNLFEMFYNRYVNGDISYDTRFSYNPLTTNFAFDYEVEKKYNVSLEKGTTVQLPDGRNVVILKRSCKIAAFKDDEKSAREQAEKFFGGENNIKLVGFEEIILGTSRFGSDGMYNVIGYVTEPLKGEQLTDEVLLKLNNKDLLKVAGHLFSKFSTSYIHWNNIWMDKDFTFYINYLDEDFKPEVTRANVQNHSDFVQWVFDYLMKAGYNASAFVGWKLPFDGYNDTKRYLLDLADKFDAYCDEHQIYYNSEEGQCPACAQTKYLVPHGFEETYTKVFEDDVAIHYNIDQEYNLKVYKPDYRANQAFTIRVLVAMRLNGITTDYFHQNCFLPSKIALDSNNEFIGYVYEATKFNATDENISNVCIDLEDDKIFNNLARLKSLIRLTLQVIGLTEAGKGFKVNPFSHVFLNKSHKRQVQILNIEFICICDSVEKKITKKWTIDYVYKILESDPTIEFVRPPHLEGLYRLYERLTELAKQMTKYCSVHNMYFKNSYLCCPKCVAPEEQPKNILHENKSKYATRETISGGEGGEAFIYPYIKGTVAKVFKEGEFNKEFKSSVLMRILTKIDLLEKVNEEKHKYQYVYPKLLLVDTETGDIFGYLMRHVENAFPISTLKDKTEIKKLGFSKKDIFEIIITIGEGIANLHSHNIYIGDLNGRNILFDAHKNVYFIDFDGMGVDEISPEYCTDGYIDPLSKKNKNITMKDDWYSYAVQVFYYLTYTHPFNGIYYDQINGRKVLLDIPDKMERRISLLANHGMKPPEIAEPWDWMNAELRFAFLDIFEGDNRESIVPYLKKQYQTLSGELNEQSFDKIYRINPKFVAVQINAFEGKVVKVIRPYAAICEDENGMYVAILTNSNNDANLPKEIHLHSSRPYNIDDILLSDDGKIAFIVYNQKEIIVVDLEKRAEIYRETIYYPYATNVVVNERTIYFNSVSSDQYVIYKRTILPNGEIVKETIGIGNQRIKWFDVKFNTKFILITEENQKTDAVYCNNQLFCRYQYDSEAQAKNADYNIVYDETTKSWFAVNWLGMGIVIQMNGERIELDISEYIKDLNYANIHYEKGYIYIPAEECLYIIKASTKDVKRMECRKIMTPKSKVYDISSRGFSVIAQDALYEVHKG